MCALKAKCQFIVRFMFMHVQAINPIGLHNEDLHNWGLKEIKTRVEIKQYLLDRKAMWYI
jgi:hypothetical protein